MARVSAIANPGIFKAYDIRGLYRSEIDAGVAELIGRAFARVIAELEGKPAAELRLGLGHDMRLTAPELAAAYRDGMCSEGTTVLDAGMVGTEMLYFLVGSRDLDGGLMCTASHNPKDYTGAKLVGRGALPLSGDAGLNDVRERIDGGLGPAPGGGSSSRSRSRTSSRRRCCGSSTAPRSSRSASWSTAATGWPARWWGRCSSAWASTWSRPTGSPTATSPTTSPIPLLPENREFIMREVVRPGRRPRDRVGRRRRPLLLHRRARRVRRR